MLNKLNVDVTSSLCSYRSQTRGSQAEDLNTGGDTDNHISGGDDVGVNRALEGTSAAEDAGAKVVEPLPALSDEADPMDLDVLDIGLFVSKPEKISSLSDTDKYQLLINHFTPQDGVPLAYLEVQKAGKSWKASFQLSWLNEYHWMVYSPSEKGGFCKYCALYAHIDKGFLSVLVKSPFTKFGRAKGKDGILTNHPDNTYHKDACERTKAFLSTYQNPEARIDSQVSTEVQRRSDTNKHILNVIVETIFVLGTQGLAMRSHRDDGTADPLTNRGNFLALLEHTAKRDPVLQEHLEKGQRNQRYVSKTIQNDLILTIAECLKEQRLLPLKETQFYSIIADEVTDPHGNQEILSLCVRFLDMTDSEHPEIKEVFVDFIHLKRATGKKIADAILGLLKKNKRKVDDIRGQAFDGAGAMASENIGTQACIKAKNRLALYTHCRAHVLNLAVSGSCKQHALRNVIGTINELYQFFHYSPKRQRYLEFVLGVYAPENKAQKHKGLCKTLWVERHDCLETLVSLHKYVVTCLHSIVAPGLYPPLMQAPEAASDDDDSREAASDDDDYENWQWDRETVTKAEGFPDQCNGHHCSCCAQEWATSCEGFEREATKERC